jgi:hypothetical protein
VSANPRPSHAARLEASPRLRDLLSALLKAGDRGLTTREIFDRTGSMAVHSDVHELRENGYRISCATDAAAPGVSGRRRFRYRLETASGPRAASNAPSIEKEGELWPI